MQISNKKQSVRTQFETKTNQDTKQQNHIIKYGKSKFAFYYNKNVLKTFPLNVERNNETKTFNHFIR